MFRTLIYPSSGAYDCVDELPHRSSCSQFVVCWSFCCGWYLVVFVLQVTDVVIHQHSHKLLKMDILMSETCWAHNKWNKITSDIKLVFHSSTMWRTFVVPFVVSLSTTDLMEYVGGCMLSIRWRFVAEGCDIKKTDCKKKLWRLLLSREFKLFFDLLRREKSVQFCRVLCTYFLPTKKINEFVIHIGLNYICFRGTFYTHVKERAPWTSQRRVCQSD